MAPSPSTCPSHAKIGTSTVQAAPPRESRARPSSSACRDRRVLRDAWDSILATQLDYRTRPCNFVEIMPRLGEHLRRPKAKGASADGWSVRPRQHDQIACRMSRYHSSRNAGRA
jgi:hypothetical protein